MKFTTKNLSLSTLHIGYRQKYIEEMVNTIFHGLQIDNHHFTEENHQHYGWCTIHVEVYVNN